MSISQSEADVLLGAKKRWENDARLRKMHKCNTDNPDDAQYKNRLALYLRVAAKSFKDQQPGSGKFDEIPNDAVTAALANPSVIVRE
jgi:hypothetical protein